MEDSNMGKRVDKNEANVLIMSHMFVISGLC